MENADAADLNLQMVKDGKLIMIINLKKEMHLELEASCAVHAI
jgi:hypothetical protein